MKMIDSALWTWMLRVLGFIDAALQMQLHAVQKSQALNYIYIVFRNGSRQSHSLVPIPGRRLSITVCRSAQRISLPQRPLSLR